MNSIELKNFSFQYPTLRQPTLQINQLSAKKGESVFIYGPSGCGKTTFLEILAGVLVPQQGEVQILQKNLETLSSLKRDQFRAEHIGYIFQSFNLIPYLNVEQNIALPAELSPLRRKRVPQNDLNSEVKKLCRHLGIDGLEKRPVTELSVGQQQRVAAARALLGSPEIILADEPTSALDSDHREKFIRLLFHNCKKNAMTLLFVSHDRALEKLFDRSLSLAELNLAKGSS